MNKNPPNLVTAIGILLALFVIQVILGAGFYDMGIEYAYGDPRAAGFQVVSYCMVIAAVLKITDMQLNELFHATNSTVTGMMAVLTLPISMIVAGAMGWFMDLVTLFYMFVPVSEADIEMLTNMMSGGLATILAICVVAPLFEEILFRGLIMRGFLAHYSPRQAILLSSLLFGLFHLNLYQIPVAFVVGCFLGWLFYLTRSLWPCIFAHAIYNAGVYALYFNGSDSFNTVVVNLLAAGLSLAGLRWILRIYKPVPSAP